MSLIDRIAYIALGTPAKHRVGDRVICVEQNGCMGERLDDRYVGIIVEKTRILCHGAKGDGKIAAIKVRVTDPMGSGKAGDIRTELACRLRLGTGDQLLVVN